MTRHTTTPEPRDPDEQRVIDEALKCIKKAEREIAAQWHANNVTRAYNDLMAQSDRALAEESPEESAFLALASIIRWADRHKLTPVERLTAIRRVADAALRTRRG